jgi:methionyl-tRNA formyltransferase
MTPLRIIFAGTPEFAVPSLAALLDAPGAPGMPPLQVVAVYTQPDRPAGRGRQLQASPVKALALTRGLPVIQPESLKKDPDAVAQLAAFEADLMVVVAYGLLLPVSVLEAPRLGCVNVHASLLPRWRGAAPIQRALLAGDTETGVCIMRMEAGLDTGPVYHRVATPIGPRDTGADLHDRLAELGAGCADRCLARHRRRIADPEPQAEDQVTYAHKLTKDEAIIDWHQPAETIERMIRAYNPWPVAQTRLDAETLRIWDADIEPSVQRRPARDRDRRRQIGHRGRRRPKASCASSVSSRPANGRWRPRISSMPVRWTAFGLAERRPQAPGPARHPVGAESRAAAALALFGVRGRGQSLTRVLEHTRLASQAPAERALTQEMVYGSLRTLPRLEALVARLLNHPVKPADKDLESLILIGLYQLIAMATPDHAAVAATVEASRLLGKPDKAAAGQRLLRRFLRERETLLAEVDQEPAVRWLFPEWLLDLCARLAGGLGADRADQQRRAPMSLRVNRHPHRPTAHLPRHARRRRHHGAAHPRLRHGPDARPAAPDS